MVRRLLAMAVFFAVSAVAVLAQTLEKARLLYTNGLYEEAKKEAVAIAVSSAPEGERAAALNLLGSIAIEEGKYEAAIANWSELVAKYPGTADAAEAEAKLPLARRLATVPPSPLQTVVTLKSAPAAEERLEEGTVLIAGSAPEAPEYADQAVLEFMNLLASKGVKVRNAFTGRAGTPGMTRVEEYSLPNILADAGKIGATSVLYVFIHFKGMENMRVECYSPEGKKLWSEKVSASMGLGPSGMTEGFIKRMSPKIAKRVGQQGLPSGRQRE